MMQHILDHLKPSTNVPRVDEPLTEEDAPALGATETTTSDAGSWQPYHHGGTMSQEQEAKAAIKLWGLCRRTPLKCRSTRALEDTKKQLQKLRTMTTRKPPWTTIPVPQGPDTRHRLRRRSTPSQHHQHLVRHTSAYASCRPYQEVKQVLGVVVSLLHSNQQLLSIQGPRTCLCCQPMRRSLPNNLTRRETWKLSVL